MNESMSNTDVQAAWGKLTQEAHLVLGFAKPTKQPAHSPELWIHQQPERNK